MFRSQGSLNASHAWSIGWDFSRVSQFMFASVDFRFWLVVDRLDIMGEDGDLYYANQDVRILASSLSSTPYTAKWYRRSGVSEDPWVSLGDHPEGVLYGGNFYPLHQDKLVLGGGMNVFIKGITGTCPLASSTVPRGNCMTDRSVLSSFLFLKCIFG